ncbi:MAG: hypothetical protein EOO62_10005 [Hymenobacter sp.]|nr:MAG: hypothetical protein EOO62_10005 [Hymenobacter sp.]
MLKKIILAGVLLLTAGSAFSQAVLDVEANKNAELFVVKQGYDVPQRIQEIKALAGQQVTIYQVQGKDNKVKAMYTGVVEVLPDSKLSDKAQASVLIVVTQKEQGMREAHFPLTNDKRYRIYSTAKLQPH